MGTHQAASCSNMSRRHVAATNRFVCTGEMGVCKTRTGYLRMADANGGCGWENADGKMRMEQNADNKKSKKEKTRNADGKKNIYK